MSTEYGGRDGGRALRPEADVAAVMTAARTEGCPRVPDPVGAVGEEDLAARRPDSGPICRCNERGEEPRFRDHVVVEQEHGACAALERGRDAGVDAAREARVAAQPDEVDSRKGGSDGVGAAVGRRVVDDDDVGVGW